MFSDQCHAQDSRNSPAVVEGQAKHENFICNLFTLVENEMQRHD